jgi:hypothetical protein
MFVAEPIASVASSVFVLVAGGTTGVSPDEAVTTFSISNKEMFISGFTNVFFII